MIPTWLNIFLAFGGSALIGLVIKEIYQAFKHNSQHYKQLLKEEKQKEMAEVLDAKLKPLEDKIDNSLKAHVLTLRCAMKNIRERCVAQGFADIGDRATMKQLYSQYKDLGGNSFKEFVDVWVADVCKLPEKKESK